MVVRKRALHPWPTPPIFPLSKKAFIDLLKACKWMPHLHQIHAQLFSHGLHCNIDVLHKLIAAADLPYADKVFSGVHRPTLVIYNLLIKARARSANWRSALNLFDELLAAGLWPDNYTYPFVFKAVGKLKDSHLGERIHGFAFKAGALYDCYVCNSALDMYGELGELQYARKVFDEIPQKDLVSWNVLISAFVKCRRFDEAVAAYERMKMESNELPDEATVVTTLSACTALQSLDLGREIHSYVAARLGLTPRIENSLLDMYAKCGCLDVARRIFDSIVEKNVICWTSMVSAYASRGRLDEARALFEKSLVTGRDRVLWTAMINGYVQFNQVEEAMELFRRMQIDGVEPDKYTLVALLTGCAQLGALEQGKWVHAYLSENRIPVDAVVGTALIEMYAKCGCVEMSLQIFRRLSNKDTAAWTSVICAMAMNGSALEALELFSEMMQAGVRPDEITFVGVLTACTHGGMLDEGRRHFASMTEVFNVEPKVEHYGCLIDLLGRAGMLEEAERLISRVREKDREFVAPLYGSLLSACRSYENVEMGERIARRMAEIMSGDGGGDTLLAGIYAGARRWDDAWWVRRKMAGRRFSKLPGCSAVHLNPVS
ncbi:pentatricopeptide repeat-containing protein At1g31430 [Andrographis paniculata]|uniref:pentatricopeptide repeat-containing protein At1g31430 n=1 Tax=Andrographis paniculata TaxID=175694 RepID=UPI0021E90BD8|nr:pentatricopeptide repeat-containing protein At1g31430 [Andrographis paniculata]